MRVVMRTAVSHSRAGTVLTGGWGIDARRSGARVVISTRWGLARGLLMTRPHAHGLRCDIDAGTDEKRTAPALALARGRALAARRGDMFRRRSPSKRRSDA